ncbi:hypothetical protein [Bosea sp. LjRoot237]|uniref:hypothetical protein n=1 Tax=Bosea sp. LjRoot237 TaxID=3342292 RepID=UPI003ECEE7F8
MPTGLTITNDIGSVQIDENWRNFGLRQVIPLTVTIPANQTFVANTYTVSAAGEAVLIAPKSSNLFVIPQRTTFSGGVWTYHLLVMRQFLLNFEESETVNIYVYDLLPNGVYGDVGLEVFNASGQSVFHSDMDPMSAAAVLPGSSGFTGVSGRIYAPLFLTHTRHFNPTFGMYFWGLRSSSNTITTTELFLPGGGFSGTNDNAGLYASVDVTGL